jgi:head-tail adaptor
MTLSTAEIDSMRAAADALLADTCTIQRADETPTAQGGIHQTWADLATGVPCRLDVLRSLQIRAGSETLINAAPGVVLDYTLYVKVEQDISAKDRVIVGGQTFEVQAVLGDETWLFNRRCKLTAIA